MYLFPPKEQILNFLVLFLDECVVKDLAQGTWLTAQGKIHEYRPEASAVHHAPISI
jgi:hypothetical protein